MCPHFVDIFNCVVEFDMILGLSMHKSEPNRIMKMSRHSDQSMTERLRLYLEKEFEARCKKNKNYSLRAFAKSLSVDSSYLSKILNQKRQLSNKTLLVFAKKLNCPKDLDFIDELSMPKNDRGEFNELTIDQFKVISDWHHYAILELINLDAFHPDTHWISKVLNIPYGEAYAAVNRLFRLGFINVDKSKWVSSPNTTVKNNFSTDALQNLQKQILNQAIAAMETTNLDERDQSSLTFCIDKSRLPEAKMRIKKFRRELMHFLETGKNKDDVYQMSISLFPVTQIKAKNRKTIL